LIRGYALQYLVAKGDALQNYYLDFVNFDKEIVAGNTLYQSCVRCQWQKIPGQPALDVELNLSGTPDEADQWIKVGLLFVRGIAAQEKAQPGKHDWALWLPTSWRQLRVMYKASSCKHCNLMSGH